MSTQNTTPQSIRKAKTVRELWQAVPQHAVGTAAMVLLCYLCVLPLIAGLTYDADTLMLLDSDALSFLMSTTFPYADHWYRLMSTVIILSFLFIGYAALTVYYGLHDRCESLRYWLRGHKAMLFFGLLFLWAVVSFALSSHHFRSFFGTGYRHDGLLTYLFYIGLFCMAIRLDKRQMRTVLECFAAVGAVMGVLCIFPHSGFAGLFYTHGTGFKFTIFLQRTHYGYFLSLCVPACLFLFLTDELHGNRLRRALWQTARLLECWLLVNAMCFNGTRATAVAVVCVVVLANLYVLFCHRSKAKRVLLLDALLAATVLFLNTGNYFFQRTQKDMDWLDAHEDAEWERMANRLTSSRYAMWSAGLRYALQKPLFGWGPDNLGELYFADGMTYTDRPHNELIQIAASLGFPALGLYLAGLFHWAKPFLQKFRQMDPFAVGLALTAVSYLICSLFSNSMFYTTPYFYMVLGFAYKCGAEK